MAGLGDCASPAARAKLTHWQGFGIIDTPLPATHDGIIAPVERTGQSS